MTKAPYEYFVSYSHNNNGSGGFGCCTITLGRVWDENSHPEVIGHLERTGTVTPIILFFHRVR